MKMQSRNWEQHAAAARQQNLSTSAYAKKHGPKNRVAKKYGLDSN